MGLDQDFPVPERNAPRVRVPTARLEEWKEVAQDEIMRALSHRHSWYNAFKERVRDGFELLADRPNLKAFVRAVPNTNDKDILIRSTLEGVTLDELVAGMYCDSTYDVRCTFAHLYEGNFLDAAVLQAHETRTDEDPLHFVGLRWVAFRSPAPAIMTSRDFLYFSYEGTAYDVDGNRVLFRFLRSMPMDGIEVDKAGLPPLVTGKLSNLHFYRQNGSRVDAFSKAMHSNAGNMPAWVVTKTISFMFPGIANVETICDARALLANGTAKLNPGRLRALASQAAGRASTNSVRGQRIAALASANACGVCFHKFKITRAKRRCQGCVREVCKRCTKRMFFFDELKQISDTGVVALRFCLNCTRQARADVRDANARRASFSTRRSSGSASSSSHAAQQIVRRVPSGAQHYQPELEPPYNDSSTTSYDQDDSDDESVSYNGYAHTSNAQLTPSAGVHPLQPPAAPLQPHQLQQLQRLQQQRHYDAQDHEDFLRFYNEYAARQQQGKLVSIEQLARTNHMHGPMLPPPSPQLPPPPPPAQHVPRPVRRPNSATSLGWSHSGDAATPSGHARSPMHTMPEMVPRHMIPPMPQPDGPASRSHMVPLSSRSASAPNLHALPPPAPSTAAQPGSASEDLETIFRLRMMLFNGEADTETMSTTSSSSSLRTAAGAKPKALLTDGEHRPQQLAQRY